MLKFQQRRRKTAILTPQGFQKLQAAISQTAIWNHYTKSCTLEALSEQTGLSTHTLSKVHARKKGVDLRTLVRYFTGFDLTLKPSDYVSTLGDEETTGLVPSTPPLRIGAQVTASLPQNNVVSWGMAPDVSVFYGRIAELAVLQQWILKDRCRLITIFGMGGIGKTWLATKLAEQIQHEFKFVVWYSLQPITRSHSSIPFCDFLDDLIRHLTCESYILPPSAPQNWGEPKSQSPPGFPSPPSIRASNVGGLGAGDLGRLYTVACESNSTIPEAINAKMRKLMEILRRTRCLLVLDHVESVLQTYSTSSKHPKDDQAYRQLLKHLAQGQHQSCVVLSSRVEPKPIQSMSGYNLEICSLCLQGLQVRDIQQMLSAKGTFQGTAAEWNRLVNYYGGNPLILGSVGTTIHTFFNGSLTDFFHQNSLIFEDIATLLDQQLSVLSRPAQTVINVLAYQNAPISFLQLRSHISAIISTVALLETLKSLKARSLIDKTATYFSVQPLLVDYLT